MCMCVEGGREGGGGGREGGPRRGREGGGREGGGGRKGGGRGEGGRRREEGRSMMARLQSLYNSEASGPLTQRGGRGQARDGRPGLVG